MSKTKRIAKNSIYELSVFFARAITLFIVPIIIARMGSSKSLGEYATIIALVSLFVFISEYGISTYLIREIARLKENIHKISKYINFSIGLTILLSAVALLLLIITGFILGYPPTIIYALLLAGLGLMFESLTSVILAAFRGVQEMKWSSITIFVMEVSFLLFVLLTLFFDTQIISIMTGYLLSRIIALIIGIRTYQKRFSKLHILINPHEWKNLLKQSSQFAIFDVVTKIHASLGLIALSVFSGNFIVALYEIALATTFRLNILARAVTLAIYPFLSAEFSKGGHSNNYYSGRLSQFMLILGVLTSIIIFFFSDKLIILLYGQNYSDAIIAIRWLSIIIPIRFICNSLVLTLSTSDRQTQCSHASIIAAVFSVIFNIILIPVMGLMGAVYAALITQLVFFIMLAWYLRRDISIILNIKMFTTPGLAGLASILCYFAISEKLIWWFTLILTLITYTIVVFIIDKPIKVFISKILFNKT
jgi:O-antigen/teichoic acid export membrane protein